MIKNKKIKTQLMTLTFVSIILLSSMFMLVPLNTPDSETGLKENKNDNEIDSIIDPIEKVENPKTSITGNATWWNIDWKYRQLITITNNYDRGLANYPVKIEFNYTTLVAEGKMNESLKDIRIVENGQLRKYYYQKGYPSSQFVTVWFETSVAAATTEYDTYLYYGNLDEQINTAYFMNESSTSPTKAFGWIRNGDFELDANITSKNFHLFGWDYSNSPPTDIDTASGEINPSTYMHGLINTASGQERVIGSYTFKWGENENYVDSGTIPTGAGGDFEGRLYSYPFIVPQLTGTGSTTLKLTGYINIRSYSTQVQQEHGYVLRISNISNYGQPGSAAGTYLTYQYYKTQAGITATQLARIQGPTSFPTPADTRNNATAPPPAPNNDGQLTGYFYDFTIPSEWQGKCVFLDICTYGPEGNKRSVFAQVDALKFNLELVVTLEEDPQEAQKEIIIITKDVDGRIIPNANVTLISGSVSKSQITDSTGYTLFSNIGEGKYNFTVEYTLENSGKKGIVFDSTKPGEDDYDIGPDESSYEFILTLNMTTIDFEFVDWAGRPLNYGFVHLKTSKTGESLENITLDSTKGTATFRWFNTSSYYYEVYYKNIDYAKSPIRLNENYVYRSDYINNQKTQTTVFNVNEENIGTGSEYEVNEYVYTNNSLTEIGNQKIINFTLTLTSMNDHLTNVTIYYVDESNSIAGNLIYTKAYTVKSSDTIPITIRDPPIECANLIADNYDIYGLFIIVKGYNSTKCTGIITIDLVETWNEYNRTSLARVNIQVMNDGIPIDVAKVFVTTGPPGTQSIVNLSSYVDKGPELLDSEGYVYGRINYELPFWYLIGWSYNISVRISGAPQEFEINKTLAGEWEATGEHMYNYNFTLAYDNGTIVLDIYTSDPIQTQSRFNYSIITEEVTWGETIEVSVHYEYTIYGITWDDMPDTGNVYIQFKSSGLGGKVYITDKMDYEGAGILTYSLASNLLSAGYDSQSYIVTIYADESEFASPNDHINYTVVIAKTSGLLILDGYPDYEVVTEYSQYFGELVNISIFYYDNESKDAIFDANVYYDWLNLGNIQFYADPANNSVYTVTLNTSLAGSIGLKSIKLTITKENYSSQQNILLSLDVLKRPTSLNNQTGFLYDSSQVWVKDAEFFTYKYRDILKNGQLIGDLDIHTYTWYEVDANGNRVSGRDGSGTLEDNGDDTYTLDFDTELQKLGIYLIIISMQKDNYEERTAILNLRIIIRQFDTDFSTDPNEDNDQISVVKGDEIEFELKLFDLSRGSIPLTGVRVILDIGGKEYEFDEDSPGVYTLTLDTDDIEAYFTSNTLSGTITIEKQDFDKQEIEITIVVEMEQIFPGIPAFYFWLILGAICGVVGSLVAYRTIQQARIPKFVKKIRTVKDAIKDGKKVPSVSIPSKNRQILKELGRDWSEIGLNLGDILGVKETKSTLSSKIKNGINKEGGTK